jgi:hypothetical protein
MLAKAIVGRAGILSAVALLGGLSSLGAATPVPQQSDPAAIQAMENVLVQSGGIAAWRGVSSAKESFSVLQADDTSSHIMLLLDDWSLESTRYRRAVQGQKRSPEDHNGATTFKFRAGTTRLMTAPEFDQATTLVGRLPAAAAEVMLRRPEYVLKISQSQKCRSGDICIDVFRKSGSALPASPEQQWKISSNTGLPTSIRYRTASIGPATTPSWREITFVKFATENGLVVPVTIAMVGGGKLQAWTFVSLNVNPGFDTARFDQEATQ